MDTHENPWQKLNTKLIYDNSWIRVDEHSVINPKGGKGIYGKVHFKNKAIGIIPIDDDMNTWLVGQYRYTLNEYSWEIPTGGGPMEEDILISAQRELKERKRAEGQILLQATALESAANAIVLTDCDGKILWIRIICKITSMNQDIRFFTNHHLNT